MLVLGCRVNETMELLLPSGEKALIKYLNNMGTSQISLGFEAPRNVIIGRLNAPSHSRPPDVSNLKVGDTWPRQPHLRLVEITASAYIFSNATGSITRHVKR